ncbi:MAG: SEC-C domain-containing protein [Bacilli bacterium]|nr:SEC-C domain-containing protein [Bacilli bacterium]
MIQNKSNLLHKNCNILPCGSGKKYKNCCGK